MKRGESGWVIHQGRAIEATCARGRKPTLWTIPGVGCLVAAWDYPSREAAEATALRMRADKWAAMAMRDYHRQDADALRVTLAGAMADGVPLSETRTTIEARLAREEATIAAIRAALEGA
jgi:hypothetical protein